MKPVQTPKEYPLAFRNQLFREERVIRPARRLVLRSQNDLAAKETIRPVMEGGQGPVAEAEEPHIKLALVALNTLAFHVHLALRGHDGFDIIGLGQGAHVHIVIHHQEFALQVGAAEPIVLHLLDAGGVHAVPKDGAHHQPDPALALAAFSNEHQHLLAFGGGEQTVAQVLLQGRDVLRVQQLRQKEQPLLRRRRIRVIADGQTIVAVGFLRREAAIHKQCAVGNVDTVVLQRYRF